MTTSPPNPPDQRPKTRGSQTGALIVVLLTVFVSMMALSIVFPILPLWAEKFGAGPEDVGYLVSIFAVGQVVFAFVWGWISDHWGRRPVMLLSLFGTIVSFIVLIYADSLLFLFVARALAGAMGGAYGVAQAYVTDVSPPEHRARAMGWFAAAFALGFILGPALGGLLAGADPANPDVEAPFWVAAGVSAVAFMLGLFLLREPERHSEDELPHGVTSHFRALVAVFADRAVAVPIVMLSLMSFVLGGVEATFALWTERQYGWGASQNGLLFAFVGVILVIVQGALVGRFIAWLGERRLIVLAGLIGSAGLAAFPLADQVWIIFVASGFLAAGIGFAEPALNTLLAAGATAARRGVVMGAAASNRGIGLVIGPALAGLAFQFQGRHAPFIAGAAVLLAGVTLAAFLRSPERQPAS